MLDEVRFTTQLGGGWSVVSALTPEASMPLVLVSIRAGYGKERRVRLDLDKRMFIDQPEDTPPEVAQALRDKTDEVVDAIVSRLDRG
jgi:hypothetical protein